MAKEIKKVSSGSEQVMQSAVCLSLELSKPGNRRKVDTRELQIGADVDKTQLSVSKKLVDSAEYKAIVSLDGETGAWLRRRSVPGLFRAGFCLIPIAYLSKVDKYLKKQAARRQELVNAFGDVYPARRDAAKLQLKGLFNPLQYPPVESLLRSFKMRWFFLNFQTADSLADVAPDLYVQEKEKIAAAWAEAKQEGVNAITESFAGLVSHLAERLSDPTKVFRDSLVDNFKEYLELFNGRIAAVSDGVGVEALREQVDRARKLVSGANPDTLREAVFYRKEIANQMTSISKAVDGMMEDLPARRIRNKKKTETTETEVAA